MIEKINLAIVIIASIFNEENSQLFKKGRTSIYIKKEKIFDQLIVLINSIKKHFIISDNFKYKIFLFSTNKYDIFYEFIFEKKYDCKIVYVEPDLNKENINFFCWSKLFTTVLDSEITHRLKLDTDMFFYKNPLNVLDFKYDIMMTYMPKLDRTIEYFNELIKLYDFKKDIIKDLYSSYKNKELLIYQYKHNINYVKLFPYFNGGFILIRENLSNKFGERSLQIYKNIPDHILKLRNSGMVLQDMLGLITLELTDNWISTPIGINYYGKWNILKNFKEFNNMEKEKIYLIHYLGSTNLDDYKEFFNNSYLEYTIMINKKQIYEYNLLDKIINLKNTFWKYDKDTQIKWFNDNINDLDIHLLYFNKENLIGYGVKKYHNNYSILDSIIVDYEFRGKNIGKFIVNKLIENDTNLIVLLCEEKNIDFYKKCNFIEDKNIKFIDKNINNLKIMSINNLNKFIKINYYNK